MSERTPVTNLLLLLLLASFLLISGGMQFAFDSLTLGGHRHGAAVRVDECHLASQQSSQTSNCANKACHQSSPQRQHLGDPELFSLNKLQHPLSGTTRLQLPLYRAAEPLPPSAAPQPVLLAAQDAEFDKPSQQLRTLRTTVLLN